MADARRFLIAHNPVSGGRRKRLLADTVKALSGHGCLVTVQATTGPGDAERIAAEAEDVDVVVAAGGDGTINEVVTGLMKRDAGAPRLAFATVPLGTINVLAYEIDLPRKAVPLAQVLATGPIREINVGLANGRHFILTVGAGVDAAAVDYLSTGLKRVLGQGAYYVALVRALIAEGDAVYTVETGTESVQVSSIILTNVSRYAGPKIVAPDARLTDASLYALLGTGLGRKNLVRYGIAWARGRLHTLPDVQVIPVTTLRITDPAGRPVQIDGDNRLEVPVDVSLAPQRLSMVMPA